MLYRLLYDTLIELRARGYETGDQSVFMLADLFHNLPLQLDRLNRGELAVQDMLSELDERAQRHGIEGWLELRMSEIAKYHPETLANEETSP